MADQESRYTIKMPKGRDKTFTEKNYKLLARMIWRRAIGGDYQFASMLLERTEGKVPLPLQGGDDDKPVLLKIVPAAAGAKG
ncbi:MAG: hypothetical protein A2Y70_03000 [Candidatus Aminicenantes bacterium RBG_13_64_14]|nr:MAG: hypothetical protein A2Y70_03000 [Candidatus Aminicenantes bacterium RBG_13_64_14]